MTGIRRAVLVALVAVAVPILLNEPASAARMLTVTPATGLVDGQTVTVEGSGFNPSVTVGYCQAVAEGTPDPRDCRDGLYSTVQTSPTGEFRDEIEVSSAIFTPSSGRVVNCSIEVCSIGAAEGSDPAGTVAVAPLEFVPTGGQPDGLLKRRSDGLITGNDVYTVGGGSGQTRYHRPDQEGRWTYALQVQNDGNEADAITVSADPPGEFVTVQYFVGWYDVTAAVQGGGFTYAPMAPGATELLAVRFTVAPDAPALRTETFVKFTSQATGTSDTVVVGIIVPPS